MDPKDRAARRDRLRARAVTTTVVATVVAAPVLALWAAYRGTPVVEGEDGRSASASEAQADGLDGESAGGGHGYENAGNASTTPGTRFGRNGKADVSVEVVSVSGAGEGRRPPGRHRRPRRRHHARHPDRDRRRTGALVRVHRRLLAVPEPVVGHPRPRRDADDQGLRRPPAGTVRPLERAGGRLTRRRRRLHRGLRHRAQPFPPGPAPQHPRRLAAPDRPRPGPGSVPRRPRRLPTRHPRTTRRPRRPTRTRHPPTTRRPPAARAARPRRPARTATRARPTS